MDDESRRQLRAGVVCLLCGALGGAILALGWTALYLHWEHTGRGVDDDLAGFVAWGMSVLGFTLGGLLGLALGRRPNRV